MMPGSFLGQHEAAYTWEPQSGLAPMVTTTLTFILIKLPPYTSKVRFHEHNLLFNYITHVQIYQLKASHLNTDGVLWWSNYAKLIAENLYVLTVTR